MLRLHLIILTLCASLWSFESLSTQNALLLEHKRKVDDSYKRDNSTYTKSIRQTQHILSVRADAETRKKLLSTKIHIVNRGKSDIFSMQDSIYIDIALLDLLNRFSDELSIATIKNDSIHQMEFNLAYAVALNGNKKLPYLDAYNTAKLSKEQVQMLWEAKQRAETVIFESILGFMIAHEFGHLQLSHDNIINTSFPDNESRTINNPKWIRIRREMELSADHFASQLCLNALIQPAQTLTWLDLNEIRRRYYGKSAEYPTTAQRIAVIDNVYNEIVGDRNKTGDLRTLSPLAPDRDVLQVDYNLFLDEFQKVRIFSQTFLIQLDSIIAELLKQHYTTRQVSDYIVAYIQGYRELLAGAEKPDIIISLQKMTSDAKGKKHFNKEKFVSLLNEAGIGENANALLQSELELEPLNMNTIETYIDVLKVKPTQFRDGITFRYLFSNTYFRWFPELFEDLLKSLPEEETKARALKPYVLGIPIVSELPSHMEKLNTLRYWDGNYNISSGI